MENKLNIQEEVPITAHVIEKSHNTGNLTLSKTAKYHTTILENGEI